MRNGYSDVGLTMYNVRGCQDIFDRGYAASGLVCLVFLLRCTSYPRDHFVPEFTYFVLFKPFGIIADAT